MNIVEIDQAILQINQLLESASQGESIIITKNHQPLVKLSPAKTIKKRSPLFGSDKDIIAISEDFNEPLEDFNNYI